MAGLSFIGEIRLMPINFTPRGWLPCTGGLLPLNQFPLLYQVIGTTYGGDGVTTFALPDLRGRVPMGAGYGYTGNWDLGQKGGEKEVTLTSQQVPAHWHSLQVSSQPGTESSPEGNYLAASEQRGVGYGPSRNTAGHAFSLSTHGAAETCAPHNNLQPYLALNFFISTDGVFPFQS